MRFPSFPRFPLPVSPAPISQAKVVSGPQADSDVAVKVIELEECLER